jgi:DNA (cytosine-5)-methyltransferase 1
MNPTDVVPGGRLQLLVASPECTHHSRARGGKPVSDQKRADAWLLMRWIEKLYVENILIENVKEFVEWGPLTAKNRPDKRYKGEYFRQFVAALRINYNVEYRVLNCADYGDPTTRERFFLIARRGHKKIVWPERTHASRKELAKDGGTAGPIPRGSKQSAQAMGRGSQDHRLVARRQVDLWP